MSHDELIAEIELRQGMELGLHAFKAWLALRAVVELHKPIIHALPDETCLACQDLYPCPTIEKIEAELI